MTIVDDGHRTLAGAMSAGRARVGDLVAGGRARAGARRDGRRRKALVADLGALYYAQQTGPEDPRLEADLDAVLAEIQHLEALAETRVAGPDAADVQHPDPDPTATGADASTDGHAPAELSGV